MIPEKVTLFKEESLVRVLVVIPSATLLVKVDRLLDWDPYVKLPLTVKDLLAYNLADVETEIKDPPVTIKSAFAPPREVAPAIVIVPLASVSVPLAGELP